MPLTFRRGFDLHQAVVGLLSDDYDDALVDEITRNGYHYRSGRLAINLAQAFGFCYGVDRAVDYAYQTRRQFPDRPIYITGEIIHNPHVNDKLRTAGIRFLSDAPEWWDRLGSGDVVIVPAFGITVAQMADLDRRGCTLVDTTCGSVLNVWKYVARCAHDGYTAIIHGKAHHEETQATASQVLKHPNGSYLLVRDRAETETVCSYISAGGDRGAFLAKFAAVASPEFDPETHLARIGLANQTTMLMSESLEIGEMLRQAMRERYGEADLDRRFRGFDTVCSATQDRQDAVVALLRDHPLDLMVVVGGYNSSNTCNLARMCADVTPTYHIAGVECLVSADELWYRPPSGRTGDGSAANSRGELRATNWLPPDGLVRLGLTTGASTPNSILGRVIRRLQELAGGP